MTTLAALSLTRLLDAAIPFLMACALVVGVWLVLIGLTPSLARRLAPEEREKKD